MRYPIKTNTKEFCDTTVVSRRGVSFQLKIRNRAARRMNFHYRNRSLVISAEDLSLQIQVVSSTKEFCDTIAASIARYEKSSGREKQPKHKVFGREVPGHLGPRRRDIPDKNFMYVAFFCCFRQGVAGMSPDLGRDVPELEKLYVRKLWADFSYLKSGY